MQKNSIIKLVYFDFPFWRVDICKLALSIGKIDYIDEVITKKYFIKNKDKGFFPFGQVPILVINKTTIAQTSAMIRYCGKLSNLYSLNNMDCALIDQTIDYANDLTNLIIPSIREKNETLKKELRVELEKKVLPKLLIYLERFYLKNNTSNFFVTQNFSISDIIIWRILLWISSGKLEHISSELLNKTPKIKEYFHFISNYEPLIQTLEYKKIMSNQTTL